MASADDDWILSEISHKRRDDSAAVHGDWWQTLPREFWSFAEPFALSPSNRVKVQATAAVDVFTRTMVASVVAGLALPMGFGPKELRHFEQDRDFYSRFVDEGRSESFFEPPPDQVRIERRPPRGPFFKPRDGVCEDR